MPLTSSPSPPWQLRWKRPRLDVVVDDCSSYDDNNNSSAETNDDKHNNRIRDHWIPISTSSIVLTRYEARTVLDGLGVNLRQRDDEPDVTRTHRRDKDAGVVKFREKGEKNDLGSEEDLPEQRFTD